MTTTTHVVKCPPDLWDAHKANTLSFILLGTGVPPVDLYKVGDVLELHRDDEADKPRPPLLRRVTYVQPGGRHMHDVMAILSVSAVILSLAPVTAPGQSPDQMMVKHLRETLESIRDQLAVEGGTETFLKNPKRMVAHMVHEIDEALGEDDPE